MIYGYDYYGNFPNVLPEVGDYEECVNCRSNTWRCLKSDVQRTRFNSTGVCDNCGEQTMRSCSLPAGLKFYRLPQGSTYEDGIQACRKLKKRYEETGDRSLIYK